MLTIDPYPDLDLAALRTTFPAPLAEVESPPELRALLQSDASAHLAPDDTVRKAIRDLLRAEGFKPTGRSKPASEYLLKAAAQGRLEPINVAVDLCNVVSLHSGLPISVVDLDALRAPLRVAVAPAGSEYAFNLSGQVMDLSRLLCLWDAEGPCANAVKDSQRTKTSAATRQTLTLIWGTQQLAGRTAAAADWHHRLAESLGAAVEPYGRT